MPSLNGFLQGVGVIVPELIIIGFALALMIIDLFVKRKDIVALIGVIGVAVAAYFTFNIYSAGGPQTVFQGMFAFDRYSIFFKLIFYINVVLTICISLKYLVIEKASFGEYYALLLFSTSGMMIMASATDLMVLYIGLELMSLSV
ncbi:MAG: NADH-quinone oxidoreductase subunit N, partial [Nitrospirae bacterium]|nr:NADH-quinone oxidoreductase subunit N [Nitrospirota bacterium]